MEKKGASPSFIEWSIPPTFLASSRPICDGELLLPGPVACGGRAKRTARAPKSRVHVTTQLYHISTFAWLLQLLPIVLPLSQNDCRRWFSCHKFVEVVKNMCNI
jgi:hypothetical protein